MKYIMVWPYGWFDEYMYKDLLQKNLIESYELNRPCKSNLLNFVRRVHQSGKINSFLHIPFQSIWYSSLLQKISDNTCVIFDTGALAYLDFDFLYKIRNKANNVKMVLVCADSLHGPSAHLVKALPKILNFQWDQIWSYDVNDCKEFGFIYLGKNIYSKISGIMPGERESDLYYVGRNKAGRNNAVLQMYKKFINTGLLINFNLVDTKKNLKDIEYKAYPEINFSTSDIPYEKIVSDILSTNCILEIVVGGQKTQTARYYEAVCYNKKLLTNNMSVKELEFYDSRYIRCFDSVDDIDIEWIKKKENIDYHYNGEFSPICLLKKIQRCLEK